MKKIVTILGIDNFSKKNVNQLQCLNENGLQLDVFTSDSLSSSHQNYADGHGKLYILKKNIIFRFFQVFTYLLKNKKSLAHLEVYPGGRFSLAYIWLAKFFRLPVVVFERGDLLIIKDKSFLAKKYYYAVYRQANMVVYKEPYMKPMLEKMGVKKLFFLPNAVAKDFSMPSRDAEYAKKDIDFLWVNRLVKQRKIRWFLEALTLPKFCRMKAVVSGVIRSAVDRHTQLNQQLIEANQIDNLEVLDYGAPKELYKRAKFFVLPSDIVFANHALLEAMAFGVVPIVSDVEGAALIVQNGVSGFVFDHSKQGLEGAMLKASQLSSAEYAVMSLAARDRILKAFSYDRWASKLISLYAQVGG